MYVQHTAYSLSDARCQEILRRATSKTAAERREMCAACVVLSEIRTLRYYAAAVKEVSVSVSVSVPAPVSVSVSVSVSVPVPVPVSEYV
jgi:hypothetical protein